MEFTNNSQLSQEHGQEHPQGHLRDHSYALPNLDLDIVEFPLVRNMSGRDIIDSLSRPHRDLLEMDHTQRDLEHRDAAPHRSEFTQSDPGVGNANEIGALVEYGAEMEALAAVTPNTSNLQVGGRVNTRQNPEPRNPPPGNSRARGRGRGRGLGVRDPRITHPRRPNLRLPNFELARRHNAEQANTASPTLAAEPHTGRPDTASTAAGATDTEMAHRENMDTSATLPNTAPVLDLPSVENMDTENTETDNEIEALTTDVDMETETPPDATAVPDLPSGGTLPDRTPVGRAPPRAIPGPPRKKSKPTPRRIIPQKIQVQDHDVPPPEFLRDRPEPERDLLKRHWASVRNYKRNCRVQSVFNIRLVSDEIRPQLNDIFNQQTTAFKINASLGYVLRNKTDDELRYFHSCQNNSRLFPDPFKIENAADFDRFVDAISNLDFTENSNIDRENSEWVTHDVTNLSVYVNHLDHPIRAPNQTYARAGTVSASSDNNQCFFACLAAHKNPEKIVTRIEAKKTSN